MEWWEKDRSAHLRVNTLLSIEGQKVIQPSYFKVINSKWGRGRKV